MEKQRDPKVSRAAAREAAERLHMLTHLLKEESTLTRILTEADRTIRQTHLVAAAMTYDDRVDDPCDLQASGYGKPLFTYKQ